MGAAPPLWVNGKPDSTNPRKGCTAVVRALRPELFVVLAGMQVNESHPLASEVRKPGGSFFYFILRSLDSLDHDGVPCIIGALARYN